MANRVVIISVALAESSAKLQRNMDSMAVFSSVDGLLLWLEQVRLASDTASGCGLFMLVEKCPIIGMEPRLRAGKALFRYRVESAENGVILDATAALRSNGHSGLGGQFDTIAIRIQCATWSFWTGRECGLSCG